MSLFSVVMLGFWAIVILTLVFLVVREVRSKRPPVGDVDRYQNEATGEAAMRAQVRGPQSFGGWGS